jgi:hypothetical protein
MPCTTDVDATTRHQRDRAPYGLRRSGFQVLVRQKRQARDPSGEGPDIDPDLSAVPEIARLGRTLKRSSDAFLAYFDPDRSDNGGTKGINGLIELHRRVARGFHNRDSYRLCMLLMSLQTWISPRAGSGPQPRTCPFIYAVVTPTRPGQTLTSDMEGVPK